MLTRRTQSKEELHLRQRAKTRRTLLFVTGLSLLLSASSFARIEAGGLLFQPVLIPVGLLFFVNSRDRLHRVPTLIVAATSTFCITYAVVSLLHGLALGSLAKIAMVWLIVVAVASSIDDDDDARAATLGYAFGMMIIGALAVATRDADAVGINPFSGVSNDNAYSIYALPALLLSGHFILSKGTPHATRILLILSSVAMVVAIYSTANRSGYGGVLLVGMLLLALRRRFRDIAVLLVIGGVIYGGVAVFGDSAVLHQELTRTREADKEDSGVALRESIIRVSFRVGFDHPVIGVGPQNVGTSIRALYYDDFGAFEDHPDVPTHNLFGTLWAGGGLVLLSASFFVAYAFWTRPREWRELGPPSEAEKRARALLRAVLILFLYRSLFTDETLTTPAFPMAVAIVIGMTIASRSSSATASLGPVATTPLERGGPDRGARLRTHERRLVVVDQWKRPPQPPTKSG